MIFRFCLLAMVAVFSLLHSSDSIDPFSVPASSAMIAQNDALLVRPAALPAMAKIHAHLLIGDPRAAASMAAKALQFDPHHRTLHQVYLKSLAQALEEKQLSSALTRYRDLFGFDIEQDRDLYEWMAWGIIAAAETSDSPIIRIFALIAAFHGEDAKSVNHLCRACKDPNSAVRFSAVQLISHLRDAPLSKEILRLLHSEKIWMVRLEVIKAIGKMKIHEARPSLIALIADSQCCAEEKAAAIKSLVLLLENIDRSEIDNLAASDRAGLRLLACEVIAHLQNERDADLLWKLSSDNSSEVRATALRSLGLLGISEWRGQSIASLAKNRCQDFNKDVAITSAWLLSILDPISTKSAFSFWMNHEDPEIRQQAAAALSATGAYGVSYMRECFYATQDRCVKINLAIGLIQQGIDQNQACEVLFQEFTFGNKRWRWDDESLFTTIIPLKNSHAEDALMSSEEIHQLTRLEVLNLLAILKYSKIQQAILVFLQQKIWGVSGLATAVLLTEGDAEVMGHIENFLDESPPGIKVQAALILALWGRGEAALTSLEQSYFQVDRPTKEKILEGIGRIGMTSSLPFLIERLQDPQQTMRLIAASAILQCLYH